MRSGREVVRMVLCKCETAVPCMIEICVRIVVLRDVK